MTRNVSKGNDMAKVFLNNEDRACHRFATWVQGEKKLQKVNDSDLAEVKPSKTGKEKKTVKDAKEDKPFRNKLECLAKSVSDKFKLTSSSPPVQKWKTGVEEKAASLT